MPTDDTIPSLTAKGSIVVSLKPIRKALDEAWFGPGVPDGLDEDDILDTLSEDYLALFEELTEATDPKTMLYRLLKIEVRR